MSVDVDRILDLLDQTRISRQLLLAHDEARENFRLPSMTARDSREFKWVVTSYYQHHMRHTGQGNPSEEDAFGEAKRILDSLFSEDPYQEGYNAALQMARDGARGSLRDILNQLADAIKRRHLQKFTDHVFYEYIDPLSKADNRALSRAFYHRFGAILRRFGYEVDEDTFAWNTRAALEYHRQVLEKILGIAKKI